MHIDEKKNIARIANAVQVTLWLSVNYLIRGLYVIEVIVVIEVSVF